MIQRPESEFGVFSGDFSGPGQALAAGAKQAVASLHQSFKGTLIPLEVLSVNHTTLSPAALCKYLRALNPGARRLPRVHINAHRRSAPTPNQLHRQLHLAARAGITTCEADFKVKVEAPSAQPNDPLYPKQWNMAAIKVPGAWGAGQLGGTVGGPHSPVLCFALLRCRRRPRAGRWRTAEKS